MRKLSTTMKVLMLLVAFIWPALHGAAQPWTETFDDQTSNSYTTGPVTINGMDWEFVAAGNFSYANTNMGSPAATINDDNAGASIRTPELNTCGTVSFEYAFINGNETNVFVLQKSTDGTTWDDIDTHTLGAAANLAYQPYTFDVNDDAASLYIRILSDNQNAHLFIENFSVTAFSSGTPDAEPTNHVNAFAAVADDASSITLTWEDNDGAQAASSFLIMASTGAPATPADATPVADDTDLSDGEGAANVAHGAQTYTFTGLTASTEYNFAIYPYTNSGADIDFLTDPTVPTASATTPAAIIAPEITDVTVNPTNPTSSDDIIITANVTDNGTVASVVLNWGTATGELTNSVPMSTPKGLYGATITAQADGTTVYYTISATDDESNETTTDEMSVTVVDPATATLPYTENFDAGFGDMYTYSVTGSQLWSTGVYSGTTYAKMSGFSGSALENEDWLITPSFDLTAATNPQLIFNEAFNHGGDIETQQEVYVSTDYSGLGDPTTATWTKMTLTGRPALEGYVYAELDPIDLTTYVGESSVHIGFKYTSNTTTAATWQIDYVTIDEAPIGVAPEIANIVVTPDAPTSSDAISVTADVTDADGSVTSVVLKWGTATGELTNEITMSSSKGSYVTDANIPAQADGTTVYYTITATDDASNETVTNEMSITVVDPTTVTLPYSQDFATDLGDMYAYSVTGVQNWIWSENSGLTFAKMSGFSGGAQENEDWLITPAIDMAGVTNVKLTFSEAINYGNGIDVNENHKVFASIDYAGTGDPTGATWTEISVNNRPAGSNWTFVPVNEISLSDYAGESSVYVAFKYTSNTSNASTWEIDNILVEEGVAVVLPEIANVVITPAEPTPADAVSVSADVTDADGTIASVVLKWGTATGELTNEITMSTLKGSYVTDTDIPAQADGTTVYYTITATDNASNETVTDEMNYQVLDLVTPTQLVITTVAPASPFVGQTFSVTVEAQDAAASAGDVTEDTEVELTLASGTGTISGTLTGTITNGTSSVTISGLSYDVAETIEINAAVVTGMVLTASANAEIIVTEEPAGPIVFFSEYSEAASGNNKYVEVYNATGTDIDLTGIVVKLASNGGDWGNNIALTGTLASEEVFVIANSGAAQEILDVADATSNITYFNGNDALGLFVNDVLVDAIGVQGVDPGDGLGWAVAGVVNATKDYTLIRKFPDVTMGNIDWAASAGTDATNSEWIVADWDDYSNIGWHGAPLENPVIANIAITPDMPTSTDAVSVSADVTSPNGTIASVVLNWGTVSGTLDQTINMVIGTGDNYATDTDIPAQADGTMVYYTITATDDASLETVTNERSYTVNNPSLVTLPYSHDFTDNNFGELVTYSVTGAQLWEVANYGNPAPGAKITGFSGSNNDNEDWMITPGLDFSGVTEAKLVFDEAINYANNIAEQQQILASTDYSGTGDPSTATWDVLTVTGRSTGDNWNFVTVNDVDLSTYAGENVVYIAFKYSSSTTYGATWEVDNIMVEEGGALIAPVIENIATSPAEPTSSDVVTVSATITDANGTVESAILHWGTDVFYGNTIDMAIESGDTWVAETAIPAQANNTRVFFKIVATDNESNATTSDDMTYYSFDPYAGVLPYFEPFYYGLGTMSETSVEGAQTWRWDEYGYAKVSGYAGSAQVNEDWLITPSLDLTAVESAVLNFKEAINYAVNIADEQKVMISIDYDGSSAPASATWTELTVTNRPAGDSWTFNQVDEIDLADYVGEATVYIAFKYTSTTAGAATWEIDEVSVSEGGAIIFGGANQLNVYPNPAHSELFVTGAANAQVEVITLSGQVVMNTQANDNRIDVSNLNNGLYIVRVIDGNEVYTTRFVKE